MHGTSGLSLRKDDDWADSLSLSCWLWLPRFVLLLVLVMSTRFVLTKPGLLAKLSALTGFRVVMLERKRITYWPSDSRCLCHPPSSVLDPSSFTFVIPSPCVHRAQTLVVSFAGGAAMVAGHTIGEFHATLQKIQIPKPMQAKRKNSNSKQQCNTNDSIDKCVSTRADVLFLTDPSQSYYLRSPSGSFDFHSHLRSMVRSYRRDAGYERVYFVGASLGGSAVLMLADEADASVVFNPIVSPGSHPLRAVRMGARILLPRHVWKEESMLHGMQETIRRLNQQRVASTMVGASDKRRRERNHHLAHSLSLTDSESDSPPATPKTSRLIIHVSGQNSEDEQQARLLGLPFHNFTVTPKSNFDPRKSSNSDSEADLATAGGSPTGAVQLWLHSDYREHNLALHLKRQGLLVSTLQAELQ